MGARGGHAGRAARSPPTQAAAGELDARASRGGPAASSALPKYAAECQPHMAPAASIRINPAVLKWVMDNEGWEADELARETNLSASQIRRWASAESDISIRDLRGMPAKFKRPMSVLYMAEAPDVTVPPHYRRGVGGEKAAAGPSRGALDVIRKARYLKAARQRCCATWAGTQGPKCARRPSGRAPRGRRP